MADITPRNKRVTAHTLIEATTSAVESEEFVIPGGINYSVFCDALSSGESVSVLAKRPDGTWITIKSDLMNSTVNEAAFYSHGLFKLAKTATSSAIGIYSYNTLFTRTGRI